MLNKRPQCEESKRDEGKSCLPKGQKGNISMLWDSIVLYSKRVRMGALHGAKTYSFNNIHFITWDGCRYIWWVNDQTGDCGLHSVLIKGKWDRLKVENPLR